MLHVIVVLLLIASLPYIRPDTSSPAGVRAPLQIAIVNVAPIAFVPPPEMPSPTAELPPALPRPEMLPPPPVPPPKPVQEKAPPIPVPPPMPSVPMPPLGVSTQTDASSETVSNDSPPPPGDIAAGTVQNLGRIGGIQSMRVAQRFPVSASRAPQLRNPLVVAYPPDAARAHLEARIAALIMVDADGKITETTLHPEEAQFGPSIMDALKNARMTPAEIDGKPVAYWTILEFVFTMRRPAVARQR
jgi:outer membrane biosynthesis protein TonB